MKYLIALLTVLAGLAGGATASAHNGHAACADHAPRPLVLRVHLRCLPGTDIDPPTRLDVIVKANDVPRPWRSSWGSDLTLAWADETLRDIGCNPVIWIAGRTAIGVDCNY